MKNDPTNGKWIRPSKIKCTMCGRPFNDWDLSLGDNRYDIFVGYPSKHDLERIKFDFCVECFDKVIDTLIPMCKLDPVIEDDWSENHIEIINGMPYICTDKEKESSAAPKGKRRVFVDMDGVLAEYLPEATESDMARKGFFRALMPREEMISSVKALIRTKEAEVFVLSAVSPHWAERVMREKNEWLDEYLPEIDAEHRIFALVGDNKADYVKDITENDVLLDDHSPNLKAWAASGGKAIKVLNGINGKGGTFVTGPRIKIEKPEDLFSALQNV